VQTDFNLALVTAAQSFAAKFRPSATELGLFASLFTGGAFFGAAFAYPISDRLGRRISIVCGGAVFCLGSALQTGARNYSYIIGGRVVAGSGYVDLKSRLPDPLRQLT
jgi:MFS family permease